MNELERLLASLAEIDADSVAVNSALEILLDKDTLTAAETVEHDTLSARRAKAADKRAKVLTKITNEQTRLANEAQREQLASVATIARAQAERDGRTRAAGGGGRLTDPDRVNPATVSTVLAATVPAVARDHADEGRWGFQNLGEFAMHVRESATRHHGNPTARLAQAYSTPSAQDFIRSLNPQAAAQGLGEAIGSEAGFLVPTEFSQRLFQRMYTPDTLLGMTDNYTVNANSMVFPRNLESSRATGSRYGGVQGYWRQEGNAPNLTKPRYGRLEMLLKKLIAMAAVTDELMADSPYALTQYLDRAFTDELNFLASDAIYEGDGVGQPLGFMNSYCKVTVAKAVGQAAATINPQNIVAMWARLWAGCRNTAVWLINQDTEPQLNLMTLGIGAAGVTTYMPPGGLSGKPYGTLMGRPVMPIEYASTLGTEGDIMLVDPSQYVTITKGGGPLAAVSIHLYFNTDEQAFRVTYRIDGQSWWASPLTPFKGTATQSHIVTLATRS